MIHFINASKVYFVGSHPKEVLRRTSMSIPTDRRIGILGRNGAGKSTLLRLIAGQEMPDEGEIIRGNSISWPLGFSGGFHNDLSGTENVLFIARIYGAEPYEVLAFVEDFSELGPYLNMPVRTYSSGMRARLAFGVSMAIDFSCYLVDEITAVGDKWFQKKCQMAFEERCRRSGIIFVSHLSTAIRQYCEMAIVLNDGRMVPFENLNDAEKYYNSL